MNINIIVSLNDIKGTSWTTSTISVIRSGINLFCKLCEITEYFYNMVLTLGKCKILSSVRIDRRLKVNINKLIDYKTYRGNRHMKCLPVRGQRSRTNAGTQKSKRVVQSHRIVRRKNK
jgi:small subunit ribosomal protein S13